MKPVVLASKSPRRIELISEIFDDFTVDSADVDETLKLNVPIQEEVMRLAKLKAEAVLSQHPDAIIIGADTLVVYQNKALGKPKDENDAKNMLQLLSNNTHQVISGVCVLYRDQCHTFYDSSDVTMFELSEDEILKYITSKEPLDKAGAYAIQGQGRLFIKEIRGDFYSIMGLPIARLYRLLNQHFI